MKIRRQAFIALSLLLLASCRSQLTELEAQARYDQAVRTWRGEGVEKNLEQAVSLFREAAESGHVEAQVAMGYAYQKGQGVEQNSREGVEWFRRAAEQGNLDAEYNLGISYVRGQGVESDYTQAAEWFLKAAMKGDGGAAFNLGLMYVNGEGVPKSKPLAHAWFSLAVVGGNAEAKKDLAALAEDMTVQEKGEAKTLMGMIAQKIERPSAGEVLAVPL